MFKLKIANQQVSQLAVHVNQFAGTPTAQIMQTYTEEVEVPHDPETEELVLHMFPSKLVVLVHPKPKSRKPKETP